MNLRVRIEDRNAEVRSLADLPGGHFCHAGAPDERDAEGPRFLGLGSFIEVTHMGDSGFWGWALGPWQAGFHLLK